MVSFNIPSAEPSETYEPEPSPRADRTAPDRHDFQAAGFDPVDAALQIAPASVRQQVVHLRAEKAKARGRYDAAADTVRAVRDERADAATQLNALESGNDAIGEAIRAHAITRDGWGRPTSNGGAADPAALRRIAPADRRVIEAAVARVETADSRLAEARAEQDAAGAAVHEAGQLVEAAEAAVMRPVTLHKGTVKAPKATLEALDAVRGTIAATAAKLKAEHKRPGVADQAFEAAGELIASEARKLKVVVGASGRVTVLPSAPGGQVDALALFCAVLPDAMEKYLAGQVSAAVAAGVFAGGVDPVKRSQEIERLTGELLKAERQEEALIRALEAAGRTVARRGAANIAAVLNIE